MRLVGASDCHVQGPFFVEGLVYGLIAAIITGIVFYFAYSLTLPAMENYLGISDLNSTYFNLSFPAIASIQMLIGLVLGTVCSVFAVRKYLR
jgi:cell division transport system permease protein